MEIERKMERRRIGRIGSLGQVALRDLQRYYMLMEKCLEQTELTTEQLQVIRQAVKGADISTNNVHLLWAFVQEGGERKGLEIDGLVDYLRSLNFCQLLAVCDAAQQADD